MRCEYLHTQCEGTSICLFNGFALLSALTVSGCSHAALHKIGKYEHNFYCSAGFGDIRRSLLLCNGTVIDGGADGIATGPPRPPGALESEGQLI